MRVVDEYVALRAVRGDWPDKLPPDLLGLPYTRHWRLLAAMTGHAAGQLSRRLTELSPEGRSSLRRPHPDLIEVLDPRTPSLMAADVLATTGRTSMLIAETLAAALHYGSAVYFGDQQNAGGQMAKHAKTLGVELVIATPSVE